MDGPRTNGRRSGTPALQLMPLIDVVFLLLVFFLCVTKFPNPEGQLRTWLPKDQGIGEYTPPPLYSVRLWLRERDGRCFCDYEDMSAPTGASRFPSVTQADFQTGYDEIVPDWKAVEGYLHRQKQQYARYGTGTRGLPVIIDFNEAVTWKHVARIVDICTGLDIRDLRVPMPELAIN